MSFPFELITMLGSTILSGVMSMMSQNMKAKQDHQKMLLARGKFQVEAFTAAREYGNEGFQWTRRIIAILAVLSIVVLPKVVVIFFPEISVTVGYTEFKPGFLLIPEREAMKWVDFKGLVITPLDTNLVAAIIGMYFGGSLVKK
jgi:hypothetical protein|tara:strand:- start:28 stop:459 length:432 start_codon:yes stop_codon:yes gene_type:complete